MHPSHPSEDVWGLDGPDYLAVVIEWDEDAATVVRPQAPPHTSTMRHKLVAVLGVLSAIVFATWGIRRLRAAS